MEIGRIKDESPNNNEVVIESAKAKKMWIHCNCCFEYFVDQNCILFLLACQHVVCENCVKANLGRIPGDAPTYVCPICRKNVRGRQVNNALPTNLKDMFHPEPWQDGLSHDLIDSFQRANNKNLENYMSKKEKEVMKLKKDIELARGVCEKQYLEQRRNRMKHRQLKFRARKIKQQVDIRREDAKQRMDQYQKSKLTGTVNSLQGNHHSRQFYPTTVGTFGTVEIEGTSSVKDQDAMEMSQHSAVTSFVHNNNHSFIL